MNRYEKELLKRQVNRGNSPVLVVIHNYILYNPKDYWTRYEIENKERHENDACMADIRIRDILDLDDREYSDLDDPFDGLEMIQIFLNLMDEHFDKYANDIIRILPNSKKIRSNISLIETCGKKEYVMGQLRKVIWKELGIDE